MMSLNSHKDTSGRYVVPTTTTSTSSSNEHTIPKNPTSSSSLSQTFPDSTPADGTQSVVTCPVPSCPLAFKGEMPHGYLWRHLKRPGIHGRTGDEKDTWLQLHKVEHDRLVATRITPAQRKREANRARVLKASRAARFELRARNMGITEEGLLAQKLTIWEGMYVAEQSGDSVGYDAWVLLDFSTTPLNLPAQD
ncbi:hypothetical protein HOY82DRAFT_652508 [Tuber indicum]|nr:hypothetical protein HOY82DRAFT_652508 [Tuber indicum]